MSESFGGVSMTEEKSIARKRMDKRVAMFLVGPIGLYVGFWIPPVLLNAGNPPDFLEAKILCLTIGAVTAFAAANGYYKVMQGRYMFGGKKD
jgi:hypothetical protein